MPSSVDTLRDQCDARRDDLDRHAAEVAANPEKAVGGMFHQVPMGRANVDGTLFHNGSFLQTSMVGAVGLDTAVGMGARVRESPGVHLPGADSLVPTQHIPRQRFGAGKDLATVLQSRGEGDGAGDPGLA